MTNGFALDHDKSLQIHYLCIKHQAKTEFLKDVKSTVVLELAFLTLSAQQTKTCTFASIIDPDERAHNVCYSILNFVMDPLFQ